MSQRLLYIRNNRGKKKLDKKGRAPKKKFQKKKYTSNALSIFSKIFLQFMALSLFFFARNIALQC